MLREEISSEGQYPIIYCSELFNPFDYHDKVLKRGYK